MLSSACRIDRNRLVVSSKVVERNSFRSLVRGNGMNSVLLTRAVRRLAMDDSRRFFHYHLKWTPPGSKFEEPRTKFQKQNWFLRFGSLFLRIRLFDRLFILC